VGPDKCRRGREKSPVSTEPGKKLARGQAGLVEEEPSIVCGGRKKMIGGTKSSDKRVFLRRHVDGVKKNFTLPKAPRNEQGRQKEGL